MEIATLFPTLVGTCKADPHTMALIDAQVLQQEAFIKERLSQTWGDPVLSTFRKEKDIFAAAGLDALAHFVEQQVLAFAHSTRSARQWTMDASYRQSWANVTRQFGFQERHNHDANVQGLQISGTFYFRTNGQDGNLSIFPPDAQYKSFEPQDITPEVGKLVLFRSNVFHRVSVNLTPEDRISFSFNYLLIASSAAV